MFLGISLILHGFLSVVYSEVCVDFYFGSSYYEATFVETDYFGLKIWNDTKKMCEQSGYQLVSITTSDENDAILNFLQDNCTRGDYAIGLSRQRGMPQERTSSWNWESGDTAVELLWESIPNVPVSDSAVVYMTTLENFEPGKWHDIRSTERIGSETSGSGYGYICERSIITTQLSTTNDGTSIQPFTSSIIPLNSIYRRTSVVTTVNSDQKDRTGISDEPITKTNTDNNKDFMMIVLVSASLVAVIVVLILFWFRKRLGLCYKSKTKMNPELLMDDIAEDKRCDVLSDSTKSGCCDADNKNMLICNTLYNGMPNNRSPNMTGQGKDPGRPNVTNTIQIYIPNSPSDNAAEAEKYPVIQSLSAHDSENTNGYEYEENPTYVRYHNEKSDRIYDGIERDSEGEVDNPAYDALPFEAESLYSSPNEMVDVADSSVTSKKRVVSVKHVGNHDRGADSNIDALYAKPDMSIKRKYQMESHGISTLTSETESNASPDKTTDVAKTANALKENPATLLNADDHNLADSKKNALYAKHDLSM